MGVLGGLHCRPGCCGGSLALSFYACGFGGSAGRSEAVAGAAPRLSDRLLLSLVAWISKTSELPDGGRGWRFSPPQAVVQMAASKLGTGKPYVAGLF